MENENKTNLERAQVVEALLRMKKLGLHENAIREFKENRILNKSVNMYGRVGVLYWLNEEEKEYVKEIESEYNCVVYHIMESYTSFGKLLSMLYVSKYTEEWERDDELLEINTQCAYVKNLDDELCSEFGYINFKKACGGLIRTA